MLQKIFSRIWMRNHCVPRSWSAKSGIESSPRECFGKSWSRVEFELIPCGRDWHTEGAGMHMLSQWLILELNSHLSHLSRIRYLFKPPPGEQHPDHMFYRRLFPKIIQDIDGTENNWRCGRHNLQRINCRSESSKGVYCLQYDDHKIISGLRDNTIKIWDRSTLQCSKVSLFDSCLLHLNNCIVS